MRALLQEIRHNPLLWLLAWLAAEEGIFTGMDLRGATRAAELLGLRQVAQAHSRPEDRPRA
jgi:hypothetical protein